MNKKLYIIIAIIVIFLMMAGFDYMMLKNNKTFFNDKYIGVKGQEIFIPKYSYFKDECCMYAATFYSLRSEKELKNEIDNYMKDFEYFEDEHTYGYQKGDLFIQSYTVINKGFYREIVIVY